ncbi:MAG TPA: hypothetical protein VLL25_13385, partial [Acidimicrobiales bacterium]|nr:hypothetical protein [Acidimicrobiales bacterium]
MARYKPAHAALRRARPRSPADDSPPAGITTTVAPDRWSAMADSAPTPPQGVPRLGAITAPPRPPPPAPHPRAHSGRRWVGAFLVVALVAAGGTVGALQLRHRATASKAKVPQAEKEQAASNTGKVVGGTLGPAGMTSAFIKSENARPGSAGWRLTAPADKGQIEGYADHTSVTAGELVTLYVSTVAPSFHVEAYRMGYYQGQGGRLIWQSQDQTSERQAKPSITYGVNMGETA